MTNIKPLFESFEADLKEGRQNPASRDDIHAQKLKAEAYAEGFAAGDAAAKSRIESNAAYLQTICSSLEAQNEAFQKQVTADFCRILGAAIEKILPATAEAGFEREAVRFVKEAIERKRGNEITLEIAPHRRGVIKEAFAALIEAGTVKVKCNQELDDLQIIAKWEISEYECNIQDAIDQYLLSLKAAEQKLTQENEK